MTWLISKALYGKWLYSRALAGESSEAICSAGEQSAQLSGSHTQQAFCAPDKMTAFSRLSRFGMMFKPLTENRGEDLLTWFRGDFLAKTYPAQERAQELTEPDQACGSIWLELSQKYVLRSCSWRTQPYSELEDSIESLKTLPRWGMALGGRVYQRKPVALRINATECGLLPTPSGTNSGKNHTVGRLDEWGGSSNPFRGTPLGRVRCASFEEWMMGWPIGWTELTPLGTDKFQQWQQQHLTY